MCVKEKLIPLPEPPKPRRLTAEQRQQIYSTSGLLLSHNVRLGDIDMRLGRANAQLKNQNERLFVLEQSLLAQIEANG